MQQINILHPRDKSPITAQVTGYYVDNQGRNTGLHLRFPDGYRIILTYDIIRNLRLDDLELEPAI